MDGAYTLFGVELSPYSVKVRSYLRYKGIDHRWVVRSMDQMPVFQKHARLPLIPLLLPPEGEALQDSTPMMEKLEALHPDPSMHPPDEISCFVSALLEEYADEWANKAMFHYRWTYEADQDSAAHRIAEQLLPEGSADAAIAGMVPGIKGRMIPRLALVGSSPATRPVIEGSFQRCAALLEAQLQGRPYLFGGRPSFGDFGLWSQLYQLASDPTPGTYLRAHTPAVMGWIERMLEPRDQGPFEAWDTLAAGLLPLLRKEVCGLFLPWSNANANAVQNRLSQVKVQLGETPFECGVQKYSARSLKVLRQRYQSTKNEALDEVLQNSGCLDGLRRSD